MTQISPKRDKYLKKAMQAEGVSGGVMILADFNDKKGQVETRISVANLPPDILGDLLCNLGKQVLENIEKEKK